MAYDISTVKEFVPKNSITTDTTNTGDKQTPYTYNEWLHNVGENITYDKDILHEYNLYINRWYNVKESPITVQEKYRLFLKNIALNFSTDEEKRFIQSMDFNDMFYVESVIPKFAEKIKQIAQYYSGVRENARHEGKYNTLSTSKSIEAYIYSNLSTLVQELLFKGNTKVLELFKNDLASVTILDLYEIPGKKKIDTIDIDPDLYIDVDQAVKNLLQECVPMLSLTDELVIGISSELDPTEENITLLNPENFYNYQKSVDNLNLHKLKEFLPKITTYGVSVLSGGQVDKLFDAEKILDIYDRSLPGIITDMSSTKRNKYQLGRLGIPDNIGTLTYYSHNPKIVRLAGEYKDGDILMTSESYGNTRELDKKKLEVEYITDVSWVKAPDGNEQLTGQIINSRQLPKFYGYRSSEETKKYNNCGISRASDNIDFFTGSDHHDWANPDVFPVIGLNTYNIDTRQESLQVGHETVVQWQTDIYGNEYALFKKIEQIRSVGEYVVGESEQTFALASGCQTYDGGVGFGDQPFMWTEGVTYTLLDGGRHPFLDPKPEQERFPTAFPDLRRNVLTPEFTVEKERYTAWYYGPPPGIPIDETTTANALQPVIYHGFILDGLQPYYDEQAYGGLFTDTTCGVIDPTDVGCRILDNYAFANYADSLSAITAYGEETLYMSSHTPQNSDAYVEYINQGFDNNTWQTSDLSGVDVGVSFSGEGDGIFTLEGNILDGNNFASSICHAAIPEFEINIDRSIPYYDLQPAIALTKSADSEDYFRGLTLYQQQNDPCGRLVYRPANASITYELHKILWSESSLQNTGGGRGEFFDAVFNGEVVDFRVCHDVVVIITSRYVYIQKLLFDDDNNIIPNNNFNEILQLTTTDDGQCERSIRPYFDDDNYELIWGTTRVIEHDDKKYVEPLIYVTDLNNLNTRKLNTDPPEEYYLTNTSLSALQYEHIDTPIMCYNKTTDVYTLSYTCKLSGGNDVSHGVVIMDYENTRPTFKTLDITMNNTDIVPRYVSNDSDWVRKRVTRNIRLPGNVPQPVPTIYGVVDIIQPVTTEYESRCKITGTNPHGVKVGDELVFYGIKGISEINIEHTVTQIVDEFTFITDVYYPGPYYDQAGEPVMRYTGGGEFTNKKWTDTTYSVSVSAIDRKIYSAAELDLTFDCSRIPVKFNGPKVSQIIFNAGDGSPEQYIGRDILSGKESLDFDISELPDQSDFGDPRRFDIMHGYKFDHIERTTYYATLTAVYSNYSKLIVSINVEADPYTIETAYDNIRLINSVSFPGRTGESKQLLTIETENPNYYTYHLIDKNTYNNSNIVGYVGDAKYAGPYHIMSDGTMMTGKTHTPVSQRISETPSKIPQRGTELQVTQSTPLINTY